MRKPPVHRFSRSSGAGGWIGPTRANVLFASLTALAIQGLLSLLLELSLFWKGWKGEGAWWIVLVFQAPLLLFGPRACRAMVGWLLWRRPRKAPVAIRAGTTIRATVYAGVKRSGGRALLGCVVVLPILLIVLLMIFPITLFVVMALVKLLALRWVVLAVGWFAAVMSTIAWTKVIEVEVTEDVDVPARDAWALKEWMLDNERDAFATEEDGTPVWIEDPAGGFPRALALLMLAPAGASALEAGGLLFVRREEPDRV